MKQLSMFLQADYPFLKMVYVGGKNGLENIRMVRREKNKMVLKLFLLKDQPCTWEMLENTHCDRSHILVFALGCFHLLKKKLNFLRVDNRMLLKT